MKIYHLLNLTTLFKEILYMYHFMLSIAIFTDLTYTMITEIQKVVQINTNAKSAKLLMGGSKVVNLLRGLATLRRSGCQSSFLYV